MGQITAQLLKANGCRVIGIDLDKRRIQKALELGMDKGINPKNGDIVKIVTAFSNGYGIDAKYMEKIFEKFYRVGSSLVHNTKGSGLGLSLVTNIMAIHRGKVLLKSKVGQGSTFSLLFPVS